ncbi:MAG: phosphatase PAP2 family protein [Pseudarcicella sp.]|nr:phosphatase PAP2 family protein [Pseudarcicella sp.]
METIIHLDETLFLYLNKMHSPFFDDAMLWITNKKSWIPFYIILLLLIIKESKKIAWKPILAIILTIALADNIASRLLKNTVKRLRPCYNKELDDFIHLVGNCGGQFGFASSHTANSFGLAMILFIMYGKKYPATKWLFAWASLVSYSRIYVGVHYPLDVVAGIIIGIFAAWVVSKINFLKQ